MPRNRGGKGKPREEKKGDKPRKSEASPAGPSRNGGKPAYPKKEVKPASPGSGARKLNSYPAHFKADPAGKSGPGKKVPEGKKKGLISRLLDRFKKDTP